MMPSTYAAPPAAPPDRPTPIAARIRSRLQVPWQDGLPVFGCCRTMFDRTAELVDGALASRPAPDRIRLLFDIVEQDQPGMLAARRCCRQRLADLAVDLPDLPG